jgi:hypothetical protein
VLLSGCPQLLADDFRARRAIERDASPHLGSDGGSDGGTDGPSAPAPDAAPNTAGLRAALARRYDFDGFGPNPLDALGGDPAYIYNGALGGQGFVRLGGVNQYVSLPNGALSSTPDKTIEAWLTWRGGQPWQRIFDFGVSDAGEFNQGAGRSYLFLTASSDEGVLSVAYSLNGRDDEVRLAGTGPCPTGTLTHVAVVVDSARNSLALYLNGALDAETLLTRRLGSIDDKNLWIGRSQYAGDPNLDADVTEFRLYDAPLGAADLALSHRLGPDVAP